MAASFPTIRPTLIDRAVGYFSPGSAVERYRARVQMAIAGQWIGGDTSRRQTANWLPFGGSSNTDNLVDRRWARNRSRDLQRNSPIARGAVNAVVASAVGRGLALRSRARAEALQMAPKDAQDWRNAVQQEFSLWADSARACDAESALNFDGLQSLAFRSALESGDVFALLPMVARAGSLYELKVQLVEADRVANKDYAGNSPTLIDGILRDKLGAPLECHILRQHPGDAYFGTNFQWDVVPWYGAKTGRRNVIQLYDKLRPGQGRGMPYLSPVIEMLRTLSEYTDGELRAALISSLFTVFVKTDGALGLGIDDTGGPATSPQSSGDSVKLGSGSIIDLAPGEDVSFANPGRPNGSFDAFVTAIFRQIGAALEIPYEVLIKHFSSSYSASRAAMLEAWRFYLNRREWLADNFCAPIYEAWFDEAVLKGRIDAPGYFDDEVARAGYLRADWVGDGPSQIDPLKEVEAAERRLALTVSTYEDETTALTGRSWSDVIATRTEEQKIITASGVQPQQTDARGQPLSVPADPTKAPVDGTPPGH